MIKYADHVISLANCALVIQFASDVRLDTTYQETKPVNLVVKWVNIKTMESVLYVSIPA
jgi:hypothetical protein